MGLWHNIKVRLGLADDWDEEYQDYYDEDDREEEFTESGSSDGFYGRASASHESPYGADRRSVRRLERGSDADWAYDAPTLRPVPSGADVAPRTPQLRMHITEPKSFTEAEVIADRFKSGTPVIMNMTATKPELAKRLIDFASGLTYGLDGGLQKISDKVFMLTPANVDVSAEDRRHLRDKGLFNME